MLLTAYVDAHTTNFLFCKVLLAIPFFACQETSEKDPSTRLFLCKTAVYKRHISIWDASWLAAFALLAPANLPSTRWHGLCQWTLIWLSACARTPGNCSWMIQTCGPNFSTSCTSRSLWGISCHQWAACSKNLTWPWWPVEGFACGRVELTTLMKEAFS